ncbi:MAG: EAL domain-containing protein [Wujia sp.]|nr:EAL domain-containing protein [Wujia sp.]MDD7283961.1 EAL domain-containing protein [Clostridium sp.]MDY3728269.1 EAL domain-containing protein [Wujia sp.]
MAASNFVNGNDVATFVLEAEAPYNILDFDQGLCAMTGYSPRELSKKICTLDNLLYVEDFTEVIASMNYQLSISNLISIQHRIVTKSGTVLTVLCNGQAFSLNDGRDVLQCVFTDITNLENAASETVRAKTDLEIFANTVPSGVSKHLLDNNLSLIWANNFFYDLCGYSEHDYREKFGTSTLQLVLSEDLAVVIEALADLTEKEESSKILNFRIQCADGSIKWVNAVLARSGFVERGFPVINLVLSDITNLKIAEAKAMLEEQKYLIISDISEELPYEYDIASDTITFADKFNHIFEGESVIEHPSENMLKMGLVSYDTQSAIEELFYLAKAGTEYHSTEFKLNTKNGGFQWYFSTFSTIYDEEGNALRVVGLLRNIHAQKVEQQKLLIRAETDQMTGLYNKATTESKIQASLRELNGNSYEVLMLVDIDDFKKINDTFGHLKGDDVIIDIAKTLQEYKGDYGIAGRLGGDEFCVFLTNVLDTQLACEKAVLIAERLREIYHDECQVTLSIGIAATNQQIPYNVLLENADTALYQAKLNGKNRYYLYADDMERGKYENDRGESPARSDHDTAFLDSLLSTLFASTNTYTAIEQAMALVGKHFDIDKICIWEYGFNKNFVDCTHQWCRKSTDNDMSLRQHTPAAILEELSAMGTDGITYSSDTSLIKTNTASMNPAAEGIQKLMQCDIRSNGKRIGFICFYSMDKDTTWSAQTLTSFKQIFRLFGESIKSKQASRTMALLRDDTIKAFDLVQNPMIVVDKNSFEVMYFNENAQEYFPKLSLNSKCYACMHQESGPCADCPVHKITENNPTVSCTKKSRLIEEPLDVRMTTINWSSDSHSFLISTSTHKETKAEQLKKELEQNINIEKRIAEASYRDIITGYGNFEKFKVDAQTILNDNPDTDYVMFYFNIKNFKYINETYGHNVGDQTLKAVADVLNKYMQEGETFARVISDTYIMLIHSKAEDPFMSIFNNIKAEVHDACLAIQDRFVVDFTTGILIIDETMHSYSINRLVDRAMMAGKSIDASTGVSYAFYDDEYHKKVLNEAQLENSIHGALENNEFCAYVQPKYDIASKSLIGGELLVRWMSPSKGFLEPAAFIPSFEKNGFIYQIDCFMLEQACKSIRRYLDSDIYVIPFSVNLSRVTLAHPDFLSKVQEIVERYYIPHHYLEFEITESIFSENYALMIDVLTKLKSLDFIINMDDFGTGYSSLTLLRDLPIDVIKLDHDFLSRSATNDKNAVSILRSIIDMAHTLDIRVVSEGIETVEQLDMLRSINCEIGQGFLFAKPMPIEDYDKMIKDYSANE